MVQADAPLFSFPLTAHEEKEKTAEEIAEYRKLQESIYVCAPQIKAYTEMRKRVSRPFVTAVGDVGL